jgi:hypothetical protein
LFGAESNWLGRELADGSLLGAKDHQEKTLWSNITQVNSKQNTIRGIEILRQIQPPYCSTYTKEVYLQPHNSQENTIPKGTSDVLKKKKITEK